MKPTLNKAIIFQLVEELVIVVSHSGKSRDEILNMLVFQHPEIISTKEEWENFSQESQDNIVNRIRNTLTSL